MNIKYLIRILPLLLLPSLGAAQTLGNYEWSNRTTPISDADLRLAAAMAGFSGGNTVIFETNAMMNVIPKDFVAIFNVVQIAPTCEEADLLIGQRIQGLVQSLKAIGIDSSKVAIDMISIVPIYEVVVEKRLFSKTYNEVPAGFQLQKNVHIHYKKNSELDPILTAAVRNEIYDLVKVEYFPENPAEIYNQLRKEAMKFMQARVKDYQALNMQLDTCFKVTAEAENAIFPQSRYSSYQAFCRPSIVAASKKKGGEQVPVNEVFKPVSRFYNQIPYDKFDIVLNPVVTEPAVQFTYNLKVMYTLRDKNALPAPAPVKQYYILSPSGDMKLMQLQ
jgi:uncharacterized protein YggE